MTERLDIVGEIEGDEESSSFIIPVATYTDTGKKEVVDVEFGSLFTGSFIEKIIEMEGGAKDAGKIVPLLREAATLQGRVALDLISTRRVSLNVYTQIFVALMGKVANRPTQKSPGSSPTGDSTDQIAPDGLPVSASESVTSGE